MSEETPRVLNQEKDPRYNQEPGIAVVQGSNLQKEMAKFEQFPDSKWAFGSPGNPYRYRPFPKMMYLAERRNGTIMCGEPEPQRYDFRDDRNFMLAQESAAKFTERCQRIVNDEVEYSRAMEAGFRESREEAVKHAHARESSNSKEVAHRNWDDRNLSPAAKAEIAAAEAEAGEPLAEIPAKRGRKRRTAA